MRFLFRLIPVLLGLVALVPFVWIALGGERWWLGVAGTAVLFWYGFFEMLGRRVREADIWWATALAWFLEGAGLCFFVLLEGWGARLVLMVLVGLLVALFAEQLYRWFYAMKVPSYTLGVVISLVEVFTIFFLTSGLIGMRIFLLVPAWLLTLIFMVGAVVLFLAARAPRGWGSVPALAGVMLGVIFGELFWAVLLLPAGFMVGGAVITIVWYVVAGLFRMADLGIDLRGSAHRYLALAVLLLALVVFSARWI